MLDEEGRGGRKGKRRRIKVRVDLVDPPLLNGSSAGRKGKGGRKKGKVGRRSGLVVPIEREERGRGIVTTTMHLKDARVLKSLVNQIAHKLEVTPPCPLLE